MAACSIAPGLTLIVLALLAVLPALCFAAGVVLVAIPLVGAAADWW